MYVDQAVKAVASPALATPIPYLLDASEHIYTWDRCLLTWVLVRATKEREVFPGQISASPETKQHVEVSILHSIHNFYFYTNIGAK